MNNPKNIVCLGGGIGSSNLLKGLKHFPFHLTVVTSMADDGGSSGRLRKAYGIMPPGDIISCIAALIPDDQKELADLLTYRFSGPDKEDTSIGGQKFGNLLMLAEIQRTGDFYKAISVVKKMFGVTADFFPATDEHTHLSAITKDGRHIHSETTLDLAMYSQPHGLESIYISPKSPKVNPKVINALFNADCIISGPGDLYTNQLPVLVVPEIKDALLKSSAKKIFVLNIANKPFETKDFTLRDFIHAFAEHLDTFPFDTVIANSNQKNPIPEKYDYEYIRIDEQYRQDNSFTLLESDLVDNSFPLYHDPQKLASLIVKHI
ncbi:MAG TPA: uridine diphosphate-N-acetylglucosamine-binding protein YvcK [Candidatus Acidoferrales bacterium]|nr:uridine diphosphate-N-acetylglucosamine-binding protein YvcK [Candidatus Acidoferrales bacterium]